MNPIKLGCLALVACIPSSLHAAESLDPSLRPQITVEYENWVFVPIWKYNEDALAGLYAYPGDQVLSTPGNIARIWFEIVPEVDGWAAYAIDPSDTEAYIDLIDGVHGNFALIESLEEIFAEDQSKLLSGPSGLIDAGLLEGDPLLPVLSVVSDPRHLLDLLAGLGYPAAPSLSGALSISPNPGGTVSPDMKEALNCLRADFDPSYVPTTSCTPCRCTTHPVGYTPTPPATWAVTSRPRNGWTRCSYTRAGTASYYKTGLKPDCTPCTAGSPGTPIGPVPVRENGSAWVEGVPATCPVNPDPPTTFVW